MKHNYPMKWSSIISALIFTLFGFLILWYILTHRFSIFDMLLCTLCILYGVLSFLKLSLRYEESLMIPHWIVKIGVYSFLGIFIIVSSWETFNRLFRIFLSIIGIIYIILGGLFAYGLYWYLQKGKSPIAKPF